MKKLALPLLIGALTLSGCASQYVMKLNNGTEITTASKPRLKGSFYTYKDAQGKEHRMSASRVQEIEPASFAAKEKKTKPAKVEHKRKWYYLWLA
jgi:hypothetical protein